MNETALVVTDNTVNHDVYLAFENYLRVQNMAAQSGSLLHPSEVGQRLAQTGAQLLLVDAVFPERAMEILLRAKECDPRPAVFVCLEDRSPSQEQAFLDAGAMYVFSRDMGVSGIVSCTVNLYRMHREERDHERVYPELVRILRSCCISARQRGYRAIYDSVHLLYRLDNTGVPLTKKIYPSIAKKNGTTPTRLEKNIRDAIRNAWENGGREAMPACLGCGGERPPTNGQLITTVCEKLRENMAEMEKEREPVHV